VIVNGENGKVYIGKTTRRDLKSYLHHKIWSALSRRYKGRSYLFTAMQKHSSDVWAIYPLISCLTTEWQLNLWEKALIHAFGSTDPGRGYNICRGGEGSIGRPVTLETRQRLSRASKQRWSNPTEKMQAQRKALVKRNLSPVSPEIRQKIGNSHTGLRRSRESRAKQGLSISGINNHMYGKHHSDMHYYKTCERHGRIEIPTPSSDCPRCKSEKSTRITGMLRAGMVPYEIARGLGASQRRILGWIRELRTFQFIVGADIAWPT
jgi:hypothetical protein